MNAYEYVSKGRFWQQKHHYWKLFEKGQSVDAMFGHTLCTVRTLQCAKHLCVGL